MEIAHIVQSPNPDINQIHINLNLQQLTMFNFLLPTSAPDPSNPAPTTSPVAPASSPSSSCSFSLQFPSVHPSLRSGEVIIRSTSTGKTIYEGQLFNNQKQGYGIQYAADGTIEYQGEFRNGKRDGWGLTADYEGEFRDDNYEGWGRLINTSLYYQGYFLAGRFNGNGLYIKAKTQFRIFQQFKAKAGPGGEYLGKEMSQNVLKIFQKYNIEQIYLGSWHKGLKSGSGKIWKENGYWYSGQFAYNTIHGQGVIYEGNTDEGVKKGYFDKGKLK